MVGASLPGAGLVAARALTYVALLLAAGLPLYLVTAGRGIAAGRSIHAVLVLLAAIGAAASLWWTLASIAAMAALPLASLDRETIAVTLAATPLGMVLAIRMAALIGLTFFALAPPGRYRLPLATICGGAALVTCALTGHAGASEGGLGWLHRLADAVHLLAAAAWLGALGMLVACAFGRLGTQPGDFVQRLASFSRSGIVIVAALVLSGVINALAIVGWPVPVTVWTGLWGKVLAAKLALFAAMLALAALNRWQLTPALAAGTPRAARHLRGSLVLETCIALGVLAAVSGLGLLDPAG